MKVGTDGALLGTLAAPGSNILDIGTGTGLLSLMIAQRCPDAKITAIDIDDNAILDSKANFEASPFGDRISLLQIPFQDYAEQCEKRYDCIICNPPYFDESLINPDEGRARARHTSSLSFHDLVNGAYKLLEDEGVFSVCIPPEVLNKFSTECHLRGFWLQTSYNIKSVPRKDPKRFVLIFKKGNMVVPQQFTYCMQNPDGTRSAWYEELMKDFYL